jgi:hypothetical protein
VLGFDFPITKFPNYSIFYTLLSHFSLRRFLFRSFYYRKTLGAITPTTGESLGSTKVTYLCPVGQMSPCPSIAW